MQMKTSKGEADDTLEKEEIPGPGKGSGSDR